MPRKVTTRRVTNNQKVTNKKQQKNKHRETRRKDKIEKQQQQLAEKRFTKLLKDAEQARHSAPAIKHARKFWNLAKKEAKKGNTATATAYRLASIAITSSYIPQEAQFDRGSLSDEPLGPILANPDTLVKYHNPDTKIPSRSHKLNRFERRSEIRRTRSHQVKQKRNKTRRSLSLSLSTNKGGSQAHSDNQEPVECYIPYRRPTSNPTEDFIDLESDFYQYLKCLSVKYPANTASNTHFRYIFKTYEQIMKTYQDITNKNNLNHYEKLIQENKLLKSQLAECVRPEASSTPSSTSPNIQFKNKLFPPAVIDNSQNNSHDITNGESDDEAKLTPDMIHERVLDAGNPGWRPN